MLLHLALALHEGADVVIGTDHDVVIHLTSHHATPKRTFGALAGKVALTEAYFEPLPDDELDAWGHGSTSE